MHSVLPDWQQMRMAIDLSYADCLTTKSKRRGGGKLRQIDVRNLTRIVKRKLLLVSFGNLCVYIGGGEGKL